MRCYYYCRIRHYGLYKYFVVAHKQWIFLSIAIRISNYLLNQRDYYFLHYEQITWWILNRCSSTDFFLLKRLIMFHRTLHIQFISYWLNNFYGFILISSTERRSTNISCYVERWKKTFNLFIEMSKNSSKNKTE